MHDQCDFLVFLTGENFCKRSSRRLFERFGQTDKAAAADCAPSAPIDWGLATQADEPQQISVWVARDYASVLSSRAIEARRVLPLKLFEILDRPDKSLFQLRFWRPAKQAIGL
jgi:hypothetical protein